MILRAMPAIDEALNEESYEWLCDNIPSLAKAVEKELKGGSSPDEIRRHVMAHTQRHALAMRCQQAASYLMGQNGSQT